MKKESNTKNFLKVAVAIAVALVLVLPGSVVFANDEGSTNNFDMTAEIYSDDLCPLLYYDTEYTDVTPDTLNLGFLGDRFYAYNAYDPSGVLLEGPVYFDSEDPGTITLLKETVSPNFIAGGTWAEDTWYGCQFNNGWLWTIDEVTGTMTLIGGGGVGLNGLAYDLTTDKMYGASSTELYSVNMSSGAQTLVGSFNTGGLMIGIAFDGEGTLYAEDLGTDCLYSINTLTGAATLIGPLGIDINYAQDMAYDITWGVLYLAAFTGTGQLYTCDVATGACTFVGNFQGGAEITGFAIPYIPIQPPEKPEQPDGPTEGVVGVEYVFSTSTTDPEGDQVYYMWDWGDGTYSEWMGPFDSGDTVLAWHTWIEAETYEVRVKAKDIYNCESDWSDPKTIHIVGVPILEIDNITGGLFKISAVIRNIGGDAIMVKWIITLDDGIILMGKETTGNILSLSAGDEAKISSNVIVGFGNTVITVSAECDESSDTKEQDAFVFLFFIIV
jgi:hypothetical protein